MEAIAPATAEVAVQQEERAPAPKSAPAAAPASTSAPAPAPALAPAPAGGTPYSASFTEIMQKVQAGETLPGIKQIEDRLSADAENPTESKMTLPPKPWEKKEKAARLPAATSSNEKRSRESDSKLRKELVSEAVNFFTNSKLKTLPINQKIEFLASKKNMTKDEIMEAIAQASAKDKSLQQHLLTNQDQGKNEKNDDAEAKAESSHEDVVTKSENTSETKTNDDSEADIDVRKDLVQQAVVFLANPEMKMPIQQKLYFLANNKGLSKTEITEACGEYKNMYQQWLLFQESDEKETSARAMQSEQPPPAPAQS